MSILVVWSSPNTDGLTAAAKNKVIEGILAAGKEVEEIHLNHKKLNHCQSCGNGWGKCLSDGTCVLNDDFTEIYDAFQRSEAFVLVTPVYWHDISENLKALLDRIRRCEPFHNRFLEGKRCMLVACAGGTGNGVITCLSKLETTMRHMEILPLEMLPVIRLNRHYMLPALKEAGENFARIHDTWKQR